MKMPRLGTLARRSAVTAIAARVGTAEFRGNLAKYLEQARAGRPVIVKGRGRDAYLLIRLEEDGEPPPFGCLADRTDYARGVVLGAEETWRAGALP
jgi:antitoxin (DNA-binding transcriptional repressor) of toxin-antitoxin stability system